LYPIYIDKAYSQSSGRRIAKEFALDTPTAVEMVRAIQTLNLPCALEANKRHSATPRNIGRVRFQLKDAADTFINDEIDCKQTLLLLIAEKIAQERKEKAVTAQTQKGGAKAGKKK
jgi:signal recognition particle subunit SEC65